MECPLNKGQKWLTSVVGYCYALPVTTFYRRTSCIRWLQRESKLLASWEESRTRHPSSDTRSAPSLTFAAVFDSGFWQERPVPPRPGPLRDDWKGAPFGLDERLIAIRAYESEDVREDEVRDFY